MVHQGDCISSICFALSCKLKRLVTRQLKDQLHGYAFRDGLASTTSAASDPVLNLLNHSFRCRGPRGTHSTVLLAMRGQQLLICISAIERGYFIQQQSHKSLYSPSEIRFLYSLKPIHLKGLHLMGLVSSPAGQ